MKSVKSFLKFSDWKKFIRLVVLLLVLCFAYFQVIMLLWNAEPATVIDTLNVGLYIIIWSVVTLFATTLLSIDLRDVKFRYVELVSILVLLLVVATIYFFVPFSTTFFFRLIAIIIFHLGIHGFIRYKHGYLTNRIVTSSRGIAKYGIVFYAFLVAAMLTSYVGVELVKAPLECPAVYTQLEDAANSRIAPIQEGSSNLLAWSQRPVEDLLEQVEGSSSWYVWFESGIDRLREDQELVRQSFCEMIVSIIEEKTQEGVGILAIMLVVFIILTPILTILFRIIQIFIWLLLKLLELGGVYKREKRMREVKELE